jgi:hypothetical protein
VPPNYGTSASNAMGLPTPQWDREKTQSSIQQGLVGVAAPMMNMGGVNAVRAVPKIAKGVGEWAGNTSLGSTLRGVPAVTARGEAQAATRGALGDVAKGHADAQTSHLTEAQSYEDLMARNQVELDNAAATGNRPNHHQQGTTIDNLYTGATDVAKANRTAQTQPAYEAATAEATAKEASGLRVDVTPALDSLKHLREVAGNIPSLRTKVDELIISAEGVPKVNAPGIVDVRGKPFKTTPDGLTYEQLALASRKAKDLAYSAAQEGWHSTERNAALDFAAKLDKALAEFAPKHAEASALYRELSKPLATLDTSIGHVIRDTTGGLGKSEYAKVGREKIPAAIFEDSSRIQMLEDALAGGKGTTGPLRETARKQTTDLAENYYMEKIRSGDGKVGKLALESMQSGKNRAVIDTMPEVKSALTRTFTGEADKQKSIAELGKASDTSRGLAATSEANKLKAHHVLDLADELSKGSVKQQKEAFNLLASKLRQDQKGGLFPKGTLEGILKVVGRAETLQEKTDRMQKFAKYAAGLAGLGTAAKLGIRPPGMQ